MTVRSWWILMCGIAVGCGGGNAKPDASIDGTIDPDSSVDAPVDAMMTRATAVSLGDIDQFDANPSAFTLVPYAQELADDAGEFDVAQHRFTATLAGDYEVCASLADVSGSYDLHVFKNGTREQVLAVARTSLAPVGADVTVAYGCRPIRVAAGDTIDVRVRNSTGSLRTFYASPSWNWLTIHRTSSVLALANVAAATVPSATPTRVSFTDMVYDDSSQFDAGMSRYTITQTGDYRVCASLTMGAATTEPYQLAAYYASNTGVALLQSSEASAQGCRTVTLQTGQYIEIWMTHAESGELSLAPADQGNWLTISRLAETSRAYLEDTFPVPNDTYALVPFSAVLQNDAKQLDSSVNIFHATEAGDYQLCVTVADFDFDAPYQLHVFKNGAREKGIGIAAREFTSGCRTIRLAMGDYIYATLFHSMGSDLFVDAPAIGSANLLTVTHVK